MKVKLYKGELVESGGIMYGYVVGDITYSCSYEFQPDEEGRVLDLLFASAVRKVIYALVEDMDSKAAAITHKLTREVVRRVDGVEHCGEFHTTAEFDNFLKLKV